MNDVQDTSEISNSNIIFIESEQYIHNNQVYIIQKVIKPKISCFAKFLLIFCSTIYAGIPTMIAALIYKKDEMRQKYLIRGLIQFISMPFFFYGNIMAICDACNEYPDLYDGFI